MKSSPQQLSLGIALKDDATFANFYAADVSSNTQVLQALKQQLTDNGEPLVFLWGGPGVGVSHLLQAACHNAEQQGLAVQYLPLADMVNFAPDHLLEGMEDFDLVCLDDMQAVVGQPQWEQALFNMFNRMRDTGRRLLMAAEQGPHQLPIKLADLRSRVNWGLTFQLQPMTDDDKKSALQLRAKVRGLELSDEVALFILHRAPRDLTELFNVLDRLDSASLAEQRRLTIPFVKHVLGL